MELALYLKRLCFVNPDNIYKIYKSIESKFKNNKYNEFFKYFRRAWNPKCLYKKKIIPDWNYYYTVKNLEMK